MMPIVAGIGRELARHLVRRLLPARRRDLVEPLERVLLQSGLVVVDPDRGGDVHGGDEDHPLGHAGLIDGALNVMAGVEVLRRVTAAGRPPVTVRLVNWADEEGARFGRSLFGSSAAAGSMADQDELRARRDADGVALPDALRAHRWDRTLQQANQPARRLQLLTEVQARWQKRDDLKNAQAPVKELLAQAHLDQGKWSAAFPLVRELESLKPFGVGNSEPLFITREVEVCERKPFSGGARFRFRQGGRVIGGVAFGAGDDFAAIAGTKIDLAYRLSENEWNGTFSVELKIADARLAAGD